MSESNCIMCAQPADSIGSSNDDLPLCAYHRSQQYRALRPYPHNPDRTGLWTMLIVIAAILAVVANSA